MIQSFFKPLYRDLKTLILDTLFPIHCLACETEGPKFICDDCQNKLTPLPGQFCIVCQKPSIGGLTHPKCASPHTADGLISIYDYHDEKVSDILIKGKYSFLPDVYKELGVMLAKAVKKDFPYLNATPYTLTAIPLHQWRQRWRGFNQSAILAEATAKNLDTFCASVLVRCKFTKTQKDLKKEERVKNMEAAFALSPPARGGVSRPQSGRDGENDNPIIRNQNFILIDDVATTGQTLLEAAKVLKRNGAAKVFCLTVARD